MKPLTYISRVSASMTLLMVCQQISPAIGQTGGQTVSYWPFKQGSVWVLATTVQGKAFDQTLTVSSVKTDKDGSVATLQYSVAGKMIQEETYRTAPKEVTRVASGGSVSGTITPPIPIIKYPIKAGTTWAWKGDIHASVGVSSGTATLTASGPTSIVTPAGKFSALKVHMDLVVLAQGQKANVQNDYWFAPNVGLVKQHTQVGAISIDGVLKSYKLK